jgi:hypothetical protein
MPKRCLDRRRQVRSRSAPEPLKEVLHRWRHTKGRYVYPKAGHSTKIFHSGDWIVKVWMNGDFPSYPASFSNRFDDGIKLEDDHLDSITRLSIRHLNGSVLAYGRLEPNRLHEPNDTSGASGSRFLPTILPTNWVSEVLGSFASNASMDSPTRNDGCLHLLYGRAARASSLPRPHAPNEPISSHRRTTTSYVQCPSSGLQIRRNSVLV